MTDVLTPGSVWSSLAYNALEIGLFIRFRLKHGAQIYDLLVPKLYELLYGANDEADTQI